MTNGYTLEQTREKIAELIDAMEHDAVDIRLGHAWISAADHYLPKLRALIPSPQTKPMSNLDLSFYCNDLDREITIREYLYELLKRLWEEGEGFSSKRPFGNSGWQTDLFVPLIIAGVVKGEVDEDGYVERVDSKAATQEINRLIAELCGMTP